MNIQVRQKWKVWSLTIWLHHKQPPLSDKCRHLHVSERKATHIKQQVTVRRTGKWQDLPRVIRKKLALSAVPGPAESFPTSEGHAPTPSSHALSLTTLWMGGSRWGDCKRPVRSLLFTLPPKNHPANSRGPACSSKATFSSAAVIPGRAFHG